MADCQKVLFLVILYHIIETISIKYIFYRFRGLIYEIMICFSYLWEIWEISERITIRKSLSCTIASINFCYKKHSRKYGQNMIVHLCKINTKTIFIKKFDKPRPLEACSHCKLQSLRDPSTIFMRVWTVDKEREKNKNSFGFVYYMVCVTYSSCINVNLKPGPYMSLPDFCLNLGVND